MQQLEGSTIGRYQIIEELGRGGMAMVYRAWQPSLERDVALKVLPEYFQHDPEFLARFQREAKAAAKLSHPNIVTIYDVGEQDGTHYIAMEYLEGGTLRERLAAGPLSLEAAQQILAQLASALDYAHEHGLVHRDIKPANVLFTGDGRAKLADFGIAHASDRTRLTRTGALMGTPEYMAPEQAAGEAVDHRTDLYALGVVLYQMLTGQAPFHGTTPHATMHAVIYEPPPPPSQLNPGLARAAEAVLLKALAKQPEQRYQSGAEMVAALRSALAGTLRVPPAAPRRPLAAPPQKQQPLIWILAAAAAVVVVLLLATVILIGGGDGDVAAPVTTEAAARETQTAGPSTRLPTPEPTEPQPTEVVATPSPTEAPPTSTPLPNTETPPAPSSTPLPPTATPTPTDTAPPPTEPPAPFSGRLAFTSDRAGNPEIYVVSLASGDPIRLTNNNAVDWLPDWSLDGSRLAFTSSRLGSYDLWTMRADGSDQTALVTTGAWDDYPRWAPDGQQLAFSTTAMTQGVDNSEIHLRRADGALVRVTNSTAEDQWPDWSPEGRIIFTEGLKGEADWDIYIMSSDGSSRVAWLDAPACDVKPVWSPDGQSIAFVRNAQDTNGNGQIDEEDAGDLWVGGVSGGDLRQLTSGVWVGTLAWSPDSKWIAFTRLRDSNGNGRSDIADAADIWAMPLEGGNAVPLLQSPARDSDPSWTK